MNSKQLSVISFFMVLLLSGCEGFRYPVTEAQKQNAWLHREVCAAAAQTSVDENASQNLCDLTTLSYEQSAAFVADYGLPDTLTTGFRHPQASLDRATLETVTAQAQEDSLQKPDVWTLADSAMELGLALAGFLGGAYGIRIAGYLKRARDKSKALKEVIDGNELFKQLWPEQADRFKDAQQKQSPQTKQLVTQLKANS
jgi:hypothetical protein